MKILLLDASPKATHSNSSALLTELSALLPSTLKTEKIKLGTPTLKEDDWLKIKACDALVIASPLYVDSLPSHLLFILKELETRLKQENSSLHLKIYAMVNCGFYEGKQTHIALNILQNWCEHCGFIWGQGIGIGAGEMLGSLEQVPLGQGPKKNLGKALQQLCKTISTGASGEKLFVVPNFPRFLFLHSAHFFWNQRGKKNGLTKKDLRRT